MKNILILLILLTNTCKKIDDIHNNEPCKDGNFNNYSTDKYDFVQSKLFSQSFIGPSINYLEDYSYDNPVFNPKNNYEFAYIKSNNFSFVKELWTFSFCTGVATKISDDFYYNLDWGSNGWLLFTGSNHQIFKIKSDGTELSQISFKNGYNRAGKWNPSGSMYWNLRDEGIHVKNCLNSDVFLIDEQYNNIVDWLNDSLLLGRFWNGSGFYSLDIKTGIITVLNSNTISSTSFVGFDRENSHCYTHILGITPNGGNTLRYTLDGSNNIDTLKNLYQSYYYTNGDYSSTKIINSLVRQHWEDSISNSRYYRNNIIIMNLDGTNERMLDLP